MARAIVGRWVCLSLLVAVALSMDARQVHAAERRGQPRPPRTIATALDALEKLVSLETLAVLFATPEADLIQWRSGIADLLSNRWGAWYGEPLGPLREALKAERVPEAYGTAYLVTSMVRRHRGAKLDAAEQLAPFREEDRRKNEATDKGRRETGIKVTKCPLVIVDVVSFPANSAALPKTEEALMDAIAFTIRENPQLTWMEIQGHAAANERDGRALSLNRARAIVEALIDRQVAPARLAAHGLGSDYPADREGPRRPERDRHAEFVVLRRSMPPESVP